MAWLLPGVDRPQRRRQAHRGGEGLFPDPSSMDESERLHRPSLYDLYVTSHYAHLSSTSTWRHAVGGYLRDDMKLRGIAREAKARLDAKLRSQLKSNHRRSSFVASRESSMQAAMREVQTEVFGMGKDTCSSISRRGQSGEGLSRMKWKRSGRTGWSSTEQDECAVCLERFRIGENLVNLRCEHKFHTRCLVPWLETNNHCPCCRTDIVDSSHSPLK